MSVSRSRWPVASSIKRSWGRNPSRSTRRRCDPRGTGRSICGVLPTGWPSMYTLPHGIELTDSRAGSEGGGAGRATRGGAEEPGGGVRRTSGARLLGAGSGRGAVSRWGSGGGGWTARRGRRGTQGGDEVEHGRKPLGGPAAQRPAQRLRDVQRNVATAVQEPRERGRVAQRRSGQTLVRERRQRVLIGAGPGLARARFVGRDLQHPSDPEVADLHPLVRADDDAVGA